MVLQLRSLAIFLCIAILALIALKYSIKTDSRLHQLIGLHGFTNPQIDITARIMKKHIITAKGNFTYRQLFEEVHSKHGYGMCLNKNLTLPQSGARSSFLPLTKVRECKEIMADWLKKNQWSQKLPVPPKIIPAELLPQYTMYGHVFRESWYSNDAHNDPNVKPEIWSIEVVKSFTKAVLTEDWGKFDYQGETVNIVTALKSFPAKGNGLVIGSLRPWLESILLLHGAQTLVTAEYHPINNTHPSLSTIHPLEMAKTFNKYLGKFDFAASFSSIEHSGLARYGDNLDPTGDLLELEKIRCFLKPNAKFYLSFPMGMDTLYWNVHRVYGFVRYPMIMADFEILGIFKGKSKLDTGFEINWKSFTDQHTIVLRKKTNGECIPATL